MVSKGASGRLAKVDFAVREALKTAAKTRMDSVHSILMQSLSKTSEKCRFGNAFCTSLQMCGQSSIAVVSKEALPMSLWMNGIYSPDFWDSPPIAINLDEVWQAIPRN